MRRYRHKKYRRTRRSDRELRSSLGTLILLFLLYVIFKGYLIPLCLLGVALIGLVLYRKWRYHQKCIQSQIYQVDSMSGIEFERYLTEHFKDLGYKVRTTPTTNDYGADLVLEKDQVKTVVQAKRYTGMVGNSAVQEIVAAVAYYNADRAMVVTNSYFSDNAINLARANNVELWDRAKLIDTFDIKNEMVPK